LASRRERRADAIGHWLHIVAEAPEYVPLVTDRLVAALDAEARRPEALALLRRSLLEYPSIDSLDQGYRWIRDWEGAAAAETLLRDELKRHPVAAGV